jgi:hypothetical protein
MTKLLRPDEAASHLAEYTPAFWRIPAHGLEQVLIEAMFACRW